PRSRRGAAGRAPRRGETRSPRRTGERRLPRRGWCSSCRPGGPCCLLLPRPAPAGRARARKGKIGEGAGRGRVGGSGGGGECEAEDGIRDWSVTGVQTCALPISSLAAGGGGACTSTRGDSISAANGRTKTTSTGLVLVLPSGAPLLPPSPSAGAGGAAQCQKG